MLSSIIKMAYITKLKSCSFLYDKKRFTSLKCLFLFLFFLYQNKNEADQWKSARLFGVKRGVSDNNTYNLIVDHSSGQCVWVVAYALQICIKVRHTVADTSPHVSPNTNLRTFSVAIKSLGPGWPKTPSFLYCLICY